LLICPNYCSSFDAIPQHDTTIALLEAAAAYFIAGIAASHHVLAHPLKLPGVLG